MDKGKSDLKNRPFYKLKHHFSLEEEIEKQKEELREREGKVYESDQRKEEVGWLNYRNLLEIKVLEIFSFYSWFLLFAERSSVSGWLTDTKSLHAVQWESI
jgi:hypothetical protein